MSTKKPAKRQPAPPIDEGVPRYRILLQDAVTGVQIAAGTDDMAKFTKTDLMKFVTHFKKQVTTIETNQRKAWAKYDKAHNKKKGPKSDKSS